MPADDDDSDTESTALRWRFSNDVLAGALLGTLCVAVLYDLHFDAALSPPLYRALALESGLAATWAFGADTVDALTDIRGGA